MILENSSLKLNGSQKEEFLKLCKIKCMQYSFNRKKNENSLVKVLFLFGPTNKTEQWIIKY